MSLLRILRFSKIFRFAIQTLRNEKGTPKGDRPSEIRRTHRPFFLFTETKFINLRDYIANENDAGTLLTFINELRIKSFVAHWWLDNRRDYEETYINNDLVLMEEDHTHSSLATSITMSSSLCNVCISARTARQSFT